MPDGTPQLPVSPGSAEHDQQQQLITRLLQRIAQPPKVGPQPKLTPQQQLGQQQPDDPHRMVRGIFGLVASEVAKHKQEQLSHATNRIKSISDAITDAYEMANGDEAKAKQIFMASPAVQSLQSKEGQKDIKQMEKLLQYDFLNPEKSKTVWHEALEKVAKISGAEKAMQGIRHLMGQHKDKMAGEVAKQGEAQKGQQQGRDLAETMFRGARPEQVDPSKILPSLISSSGADLRQQERLLHDQWKVAEHERFTELVDNDPRFQKDPILKQVGKGIQAALDGDTEGANKFFNLAQKGAAAKKGPQPMSMNKAITDLQSTDPDIKKFATKWLDDYVGTQTRLLTPRGMAFGMGRMFNWYNEETGETRGLNGFQVQALEKQGEHWIMTSPIPPDKLAAAQQISRSMLLPDSTGKSLRENLMSDMSALDNASDRAIISRVLRENPQAYSQDPSTLGIWLDANLTGKLSEQGQNLVRDVKQYAEVFARSAAVTGQTRTEMNTVLLLALLPSERTPNSKYGTQQLLNSFDYLDGMVNAPILGGGRYRVGATPKAATPKKETAKPAETPVIDLDKP